MDQTQAAIGKANRRLGRTASGLAMAALMVGGAARADAPGRAADLVIEHAKVITLDEADTIASAVAVRGGQIVAVGNEAAMAPWIDARTKVVDAHGRALLPGFIDAHAHVQGLAESEYVRIPIQAPPLKDGAAIIAALKARAATLPPGAWLVGQGTYNQPMPTRAEIDAAFPDNPVDLRWSIHDSLINHKAAVLSGLTRDAPDPKGAGRFERTPDGEVMILRDAGITLPEPTTTYAQSKASIASTLVDFYLKRGVTTVYDMSDPHIAYRAYQELRAEGHLPVRILMNYFIGPNDGMPGNTDHSSVTDGMMQGGMLESLLQSGLHTGMGDDWLRIGSLKIVLDGVWGTTAAVYKPVWKGSGTTWIPNNVGGVSRSQEVLNRQFTLAQQNGWSVWVHANGDRAQDMVLTAVEAAQKVAPVADARHRIEHFGHFLVEDPARTAERLRRMKADGVIPSPQVAMLWRLTNTNVQEPDVTFFALKTLLDQGFQPPSGSDTLGTQNYATNPFFSIDRAVNRTTKFGTVVQPEQAITVEQALRMNTIWAARSAHLDASRGSIELGKLADLVLVDADPLTVPHADLGKISPVMTVVDGRIAWRRQP
jgi:predicted amidohydrolase YtcJ